MNDHTTSFEKEAVVPVAAVLLYKALMLALAAYSAKEMGASFGSAAANFESGNSAAGWKDVGLGTLESMGMLPGVGMAGRGLKGLGVVANAARTGNLAIKATRGASAADLMAIRLANTMLNNPAGLRMLQKIKPGLVGSTGAGLTKVFNIFNTVPATIAVPTLAASTLIPESLNNRKLKTTLNTVDRVMQGGVPFGPSDYGSYMPQPTPHIYRPGQSFADTLRQLRGNYRAQGLTGPMPAPRTELDAIRQLRASNQALGRTASGGTRWTPMVEKIENFLIRSQAKLEPANPTSLFGGKFKLPKAQMDMSKVFPSLVEQPAVKTSQDYSILTYQPGLRNRTLEDLYAAIRADMSLDVSAKAQLIEQVRGLTGMASSSTPLSALMMKGLGGVLGYLLSKYFGMSPMGQLISTVAGYGLGSALNNYLNKPPDPYPGYRMLV